MVTEVSLHFAVKPGILCPGCIFPEGLPIKISFKGVCHQDLCATFSPLYKLLNSCGGSYELAGDCSQRVTLLLRT